MARGSFKGQTGSPSLKNYADSRCQLGPLVAMCSLSSSRWSQRPTDGESSARRDHHVGQKVYHIDSLGTRGCGLGLVMTLVESPENSPNT